jgi:hypothetical protein
VMVKIPISMSINAYIQNAYKYNINTSKIH